MANFATEVDDGWVTVDRLDVPFPTGRSQSEAAARGSRSLLSRGTGRLRQKLGLGPKSKEPANGTSGDQVFHSFELNEDGEWTFLELSHGVRCVPKTARTLQWRNGVTARNPCGVVRRVKPTPPSQPARREGGAREGLIATQPMQQLVVQQPAALAPLVHLPPTSPAESPLEAQGALMQLEDDSDTVACQGLSASLLVKPQRVLVLESDEDAVSLSSRSLLDDFVYVSQTPETFLRSLRRRRPGWASVSLWAWMGCLLLGELLTTFWWLHSLGWRGCIVLAMLTCLVGGMIMSTLGAEKTGVVVVSLLMAVGPALPAYSAVLLMLPIEASDHSWAVLHWPTSFLIGLIYLSDSIDKPVCGKGVYAAFHAKLQSARRAARGSCVTIAWVYAFVCVQACVSHASEPGRSLREGVRRGLLAGPLASGHGIVLAFHAIGLVCAEYRQQTVRGLGTELLPQLLGAKRASALTLKALAMEHGGRIFKLLPTLRRFSPPSGVVAFLIAMRQNAPLLLPMLALSLQLSRFGVYWWSCIIFLGLVGKITFATICEWHALPSMSLQRLPMLLPKGVIPLKRKFVGYALVAIEGFDRARSRVYLK